MRNKTNALFLLLTILLNSMVPPVFGYGNPDKTRYRVSNIFVLPESIVWPETVDPRVIVVTIVKVIKRNLERGELSFDNLVPLMNDRKILKKVKVEIERYKSGTVREIALRVLSDGTCVFISIPEGDILVSGPSANAIKRFIPGSSFVATSNPVTDGSSVSTPGSSASWGATNDISSIYLNYVEGNTDILSMILKENKDRILLRIPVESINNELFIESIMAFLGSLQLSGNVYVELFHSDGSVFEADNYKNYGLSGKFPEDFIMKKGNTITLVPVFDGEPIDSSVIQHKLALSAVTIDATTIAPVRVSETNVPGNASGIVGGMMFASGLLAITRLSGSDRTEDREVVKEVKDRYALFLKSQNVTGYDAISEADLMALASGDINRVAKPFRKIAFLLPVGPTSANEMRQVFEFARIALVNL